MPLRPLLAWNILSPSFQLLNEIGFDSDLSIGVYKNDLI